MKRKQYHALKLPVLMVYVVAFYGLWTIWEICGKDLITKIIENEYLLQFIKSGIVKNAVWTLPAVLLIHHFRSDMYVGLKDMFLSRISIIRYLPIFLFFTLYLLGGVILQKGKLSVSGTFRLSDLIIVLFVGITEEMVFRGWLLNAAVSEQKKWIPVIINSIMFLFIHFPIWIHDSVFVQNFQSFGFICIIILSGIFSWTFIKSKSIWIPVLLHMYWDLLMFVFY